MKKILAILLALVCIATVFAACGGKDETETTTTTTEAVVDDTTVAADDTTVAADDTTVAADDTTVAADDTTVAADDTTVAADDTTVAADDTTAAADTTTAAAKKDMTKAEFVAFFNAETAKIVKSGSYNLKRDCSYTDPIDVGSATGTLNSIISAIDENENLDTVVGGFLGIGVKQTTVTNGKAKDDINKDYMLQATKLTEADLGSFSASNGTYTFTLANATNPKKTGATPLSRFTRDFITHEEVVDGIAGFTTAITVKETNVNYKNIKVTVKVVDGKIADINYSYNFDATLALKAVITINGDGAAKTVGTYSAIKY